jgi:hypothetical protein
MTASTLMVTVLGLVGSSAGHAANEKTLLHAAFPDYDEQTSALGENEGWLLQTASFCEGPGSCFLAAAAIDQGPARGSLAGRHPWTTLYALKLRGVSFAVESRWPGPAVSANGTPFVSLAIRLEGTTPVFHIVVGATSAEEGNITTATLLYWDGVAFQRILSASGVQVEGREAEALVATCAELVEGRPTYEVVSREREQRGWIESLTRYSWVGTAYAGRCVTRECPRRSGVTPSRRWPLSCPP